MTLTKAHIIESILKQTGFSKNKSAEIIEIILETIKRSLETGDDVLISGFGKLTPIAKAIPKIRLACIAAIKEIADIFPSAIAERDIGEVKALFIKP